MRHAEAPEMDTIGFSLKRADQRMIAFQHALLAPFSITPARYVMLFAVLRDGTDIGTGEPAVYQSELRRALGVTAPTVSIMVRALEALGFVRRMRCTFGDRRQIFVILTKEGRALLDRIMKKVIRPGVLWIAARTIFDMDAAKVATLQAHLDRLRRGLRDRATLRYPWCDRTLYPNRRWKPPAPFQWPSPPDRKPRSTRPAPPATSPIATSTPA